MRRPPSISPPLTATDEDLREDSAEGERRLQVNEATLSDDWQRSHAAVGSDMKGEVQEEEVVDPGVESRWTTVASVVGDVTNEDAAVIARRQPPLLLEVSGMHSQVVPDETEERMDTKSTASKEGDGAGSDGHSSSGLSGASVQGIYQGRSGQPILVRAPAFEQYTASSHDGAGT